MAVLALWAVESTCLNMPLQSLSNILQHPNHETPSHSILFSLALHSSPNSTASSYPLDISIPSRLFPKPCYPTANHRHRSAPLPPNLCKQCTDHTSTATSRAFEAWPRPTCWAEKFRRQIEETLLEGCECADGFRYCSRPLHQILLAYRYLLFLNPTKASSFL